MGDRWPFAWVFNNSAQRHAVPILRQYSWRKVMNSYAILTLLLRRLELLRDINDGTTDRVIDAIVLLCVPLMDENNKSEVAIAGDPRRLGHYDRGPGLQETLTNEVWGMPRFCRLAALRDVGARTTRRD